MGEDTSRLDGAVRTEDAEYGRRSRGGRDGADPESTSGGRLQLSVHPSQARIVRRILVQCTARRGSDGAVQVGALGRCDGSTVRLAEADAHRLTVGHANITTEAVQHIVLRTNGISLINEIDETAFLHTILTTFQIYQLIELPFRATTSNFQ